MWIFMANQEVQYSTKSNSVESGWHLTFQYPVCDADRWLDFCFDCVDWPLLRFPCWRAGRRVPLPSDFPPSGIFAILYGSHLPVPPRVRNFEQKFSELEARRHFFKIYNRKVHTIDDGSKIVEKELTMTILAGDFSVTPLGRRFKERTWHYHALLVPPYLPNFLMATGSSWNT